MKKTLSPIEEATSIREQAEQTLREARTKHATAQGRLQELLRLTGPTDNTGTVDLIRRAEARAGLPSAEHTFLLAKAKLVQAERDYAAAREAERKAILDARRPERCDLIAQLSKRVEAATQIADRIREHDETTTILTGHQLMPPWPELQREGWEARAATWKKEGWL